MILICIVIYLVVSVFSTADKKEVYVLFSINGFSIPNKK